LIRHYVISNLQLAFATVTIAIFVTIGTIAANMVLANLELPQIVLAPDGACAKVINFKNGDGYACQDKDVTLRKYKISPSAAGTATGAKPESTGPAVGAVSPPH
jgi:hypothetical protein